MNDHIPTCRIHTEYLAGEHVTYSEPDPNCQHESHEQ